MNIFLIVLVIALLGGLTIGFGLLMSGRQRWWLTRLGVVVLAVIAAFHVAFFFAGERDFGFIRFALVEGFVAALGVGLGMAVAFFSRLIQQESNKPAQAVESPAQEQDRQMILDMLRDGKVSGEQAAELLKAVSAKSGPAERLPMTRPVLGPLSGAVLVVIGFMLPWAYVHMNMPLGGSTEGYQTGANVGFVGWVILSAGILPALLVCIPALDKLVRQGLLRMVIAALGGAFIISLLVRSPQGIGLWVAAVGFALQLFIACWQAGPIGGSARGCGR